ncbi:hypothetical protein XENTR_v10021066 [Xenopus tropicalis]|uniref:Growth hormone secretagogue receptor type 1 n=1 Tax=Xenopus tropicalis TaxID=8364 RepID=A0A8J0T5F4_XENTR|nr:growth hormone secretagogue receptor type 1 [Xenopus tropicalis]KAE8584690.1 hypothetical protein XENTR_v10021066 [Xenopus tropicalis]|eukprot:XP_017951879.1 PREDICTED: growth hormone secretagogue receptor type 1-like [Xenopus tropicalis]
MGFNVSAANTGSHSNYTTEDMDSLFHIYVLVPVTILCISLFLLGITGNLLTIIVFKRYRDMRSTVNMYLSSMAVSDILIFLGLPSDLYRIWKYKPYAFGNFVCKFLVYLSESCTYCTILHITMVSIERYIAICFPLKAKIIITKRRVKIVIILLWIFALLTASPILFLFGVEHPPGFQPEETKECKYTEQSAQNGLLHVMTWVSTIYFFLPMFFLTFLYGLICRKLWQTRHWARGPATANRGKYNKATVKMLAVVVVCFMLCWLPFHIGRILFALAGVGEYVFFEVTQYFNLLSMVLFYLSASINPMLYNIMSEKYRSAMRRMLYPKQGLQSGRTRSYRFSLEGTELSSGM